jgi:CBS domain-containing protein
MTEPDAARLQIHVRRVASGDGTLESEPEVYCPPRDKSMPVSDCESCEDYAGSGIDLDAGRNFVLCRRLTSESARSLRAARRAYIGRRMTVEGTSPSERTPVTEIMTSDVLCVREDLPLSQLARLLLDRGVTGAPVVNERGEPIGVVSQHDVLGVDRPATVGEVMTRLTFVLPESASISQAAALMSFEGVHRLPIVSDDGKVVGIVSPLDILRWLARLDGYLMPERR